MKDDDRGGGRTTKQMQDAPANAIFVWCNNQLSYPKCLAAHLGRPDLRLHGPGFFDVRSPRWQGLTNPVVVDHAAPSAFDKYQRLGFHEWINYHAARVEK